MSDARGATINFVDADSGDQGFFVVRVVENIIGIATSLRQDGDIEVFIPPEVARRLADAVSRAAAEIE